VTIQLNNSRLQGVLKTFVWPLFLFTTVTVVLTYPVSLNPGSMIIGRPFEDAFEYVWYLSWYKQALFDANVSPLYQPDIFYPTGWNLAFSAFPPIHPTLAAPMTAILGAVRTYNLFVMFTCVVAAYGIYLMVKILGGNAWGAVFAGIAFAFYPQRAVYLGGHLNFLVGTMWLPWLFYGLIRARQSTRRRTAWMAFAGFTFAMTIGGSWHFLFLSSIGFSSFAIVYLWADLRDGERRSDWIWPSIAFLLTAIVVIAPFLLNAYSARAQLGGNALFDFTSTNRTSVSLERFLIPSAINPIFWDFARVRFPLWNGQDAVVHFGYITLLLSAYALWRLRPWSSVVRALLIMLLVSTALMLGLMLHWMGEPVSFPMTNTALIERFLPMLVLENGRIGIPMPALLLYVLHSPFRSFHAFSRWGLISMLGLSVLAGLGLSSFLHHRHPGICRALIGCAAILILGFEFNTQPLASVTRLDDIQRSVDTWLAAQPEQNVIIEYPLDYAGKGQTLYYSTIHGQKMVHGAGSLIPQLYTANLPTLNQWPAETTTSLLEELGVRYVLVDVFEWDTTFEEDTLPAILVNESLEPVRVFEEQIGPVRAIYVFEIVGQDHP
jgi:hypothetical protein